MNKIAPENIPRIMPDGVKCVIKRGNHLLMIHQSPPALRSLKWIRADSPAPYGPGCTYRDVTIALPYVITFAVFQPLPAGGHTLSPWNECFFSRRALLGMDDQLCYPGLLNCSKFQDGDHRSTSAWICTQKLNYRQLMLEKNHDLRIVKGLSALLNCLFESGFNYSSEQHEGNSWYTVTKDRDQRISTVENWEKASEQNPLFVLDVPWIETPVPVSEIVDRVFNMNNAVNNTVTTAADLERVVVNETATPRKPKGKVVT